VATEKQENGEPAASVRRIRDYIDLHITERITLHDIARAAGYSPWHAERLFKEHTGVTPFEYLRGVRLTRAATDLAEGNGRIIDIALDYVFDSHEGFTRAFTRRFGMSPREFRLTRPPLKPFLPALPRAASIEYYRGDREMAEKTKTGTVFVQVIDRPARKFILKRGVKAADYFAYCEEVPCEVWDVLTGVKDALYEPIGAWLPDRFIVPGTSKYVQGVEMPADYAGPVPEGMDVMDLPPCRIMVFQGPPYDDNDFMEAIGDLWEVMKTYDPTLYGFRWADDDGPRFQLEPRGYRGYIEARPVRSLNE
jgi:AraC family transcriptional regulator